MAVADAPNTNTVILMTHTISLSDACEESRQSQHYKQSRQSQHYKQCAGSLRDEQDKCLRFNTDLIQYPMSKADGIHGNWVQGFRVPYEWSEIMESFSECTGDKLRGGSDVTHEIRQGKISPTWGTDSTSTLQTCLCKSPTIFKGNYFFGTLNQVFLEGFPWKKKPMGHF